MTNPFETIDVRLSNIETLLLEIKFPKIPEPSEKELLTIDEAAEFLNLSKGTLYKLVHFQQIPVNKPRNGRLFFRRSELMAWVEAGRKATKSEISEAVDEQLAGR